MTNAGGRAERADGASGEGPGTRRAKARDHVRALHVLRHCAFGRALRQPIELAVAAFGCGGKGLALRSRVFRVNVSAPSVLDLYAGNLVPAEDDRGSGPRQRRAVCAAARRRPEGG